MKKLGFTDFELENLNESINKKKSYVYADVADRLEKVAFDVVRFKDDDLSHLWEVQKSDDGTDIIVAMYDEAATLKTESEWNVFADKKASINIFYKGEAVHKFAASQMGFGTEDVNIVCRTLTASLSEDKAFVEALVRDIPLESRNFLLQKYPELKGNS